MPEMLPTEPQPSGIRVDTARIRNFRSLRDVEVSLGDTCLLVGMNNSGKTSFLRALHLALGADRRLVQADDFFVDEEGRAAEEILIDVRIIPAGEDGTRRRTFPDLWIDSDFGEDLIATDPDDQEFVAVRTRITHDAVGSDFALERKRLPEWPEFEGWAEATTGADARRFRQLLSFFIDAQRDIVADLRSRSSYFGRMLSKVELPETEVAAIEGRLRELNEDIVRHSDVLEHIRNALAELNRTVPSFGEGVELTPVSKRLRDLSKGMGVQFSDSAGSSFPLDAHGMGTRSWASLLSFEAYLLKEGYEQELRKAVIESQRTLREQPARTGEARGSFGLEQRRIGESRRFEQDGCRGPLGTGDHRFRRRPGPAPKGPRSLSSAGPGACR